MKDGYFESASPWTFRDVAIELHRFLKATPEDDWLKRTRNSKQDQADIEKLEDDKNR